RKRSAERRKRPAGAKKRRRGWAKAPGCSRAQREGGRPRRPPSSLSRSRPIHPQRKLVLTRLIRRAEDASLAGTAADTCSQRVGTTDLGQPVWPPRSGVHVRSYQGLPRPVAPAI